MSKCGFWKTRSVPPGDKPSVGRTVVNRTMTNIRAYSPKKFLGNRVNIQWITVASYRWFTNFQHLFNWDSTVCTIRIIDDIRRLFICDKIYWNVLWIVNSTKKWSIKSINDINNRNIPTQFSTLYDRCDFSTSPIIKTCQSQSQFGRCAQILTTCTGEAHRRRYISELLDSSIWSCMRSPQSTNVRIFFSPLLPLSSCQNIFSWV